MCSYVATVGFDSQPLREVIEHHDGYFAFVGRGHEGRPQQAAALPHKAFRPFVTRAERRRQERRQRRGYKPRRKKHNRRYEYAWVVTNLPESFSTEDVVDHTYQRCDQENVIEQMGSGLAAWRMPVAEFDGMGARASDVGAPHGRALDHRPARTRLRRFVTSVSCCRRTTRRRESVRRTAAFARREISH